MIGDLKLRGVLVASQFLLHRLMRCGMSDVLSQRAKTLASYYAANGLAGMKPGEVLLLLSEKQRHLADVMRALAEGKVSAVSIVLKRGLEAEVLEISSYFGRSSRGGRER